MQNLRIALSQNGTTGLLEIMSRVDGVKTVCTENELIGFIGWYANSTIGLAYGSLHLHIGQYMITITKTSKHTLNVAVVRPQISSNTSAPQSLSQREVDLITRIITYLFTAQHRLAIAIFRENGTTDTLLLRTSAQDLKKKHGCLQASVTSPLNTLLMDRDWETRR